MLISGFLGWSQPMRKLPAVLHRKSAAVVGMRLLMIR